MIKALFKSYLSIQAAAAVGYFAATGSSFAQQTYIVTSKPDSDFSDIARNMTTSIEMLPGMVSGLAYMLGLMMGLLGVLKIKDHVENPSQTPLKDGAIRIASGGAMFALPIIYEAMNVTIGHADASVSGASLNAVELNAR